MALDEVPTNAVIVSAVAMALFWDHGNKACSPFGLQAEEAAAFMRSRVQELEAKEMEMEAEVEELKRRCERLEMDYDEESQ